MGTHISRVKSVDLDAWTDEHLQSVLRWGNTRANKYWEAKLAPGHVPSEAKIENFIRTKYEAKRWVMDGDIPDPASLDTEGDDDVPLNLVQEKAKLERSALQRASSTSGQPPLPLRRQPQHVDLFDDSTIAPPRANTASPSVSGPPPPPKTDVAPKQSKPGESLLGLDFFGSSQLAPSGRPSSAASNFTGSTAPSRPDLKQSILSLYASGPRQQPHNQAQNTQSTSFGGMPSPPIQQQPQQSSFGGLDDAFSGLSFASPALPLPKQPQQQSKPSPFANLGNVSSQRSTPAAAQVMSPSSTTSGGGFFNTAPKPTQVSSPPPPKPSQAQRSFSSSSGFGGFESAPGLSPVTSSTSKPNTSAGLDDLFDFGAASPPPPPPKPAISPPTQNFNSAFNLSAPAAPGQNKPQPVRNPAQNPAQNPTVSTSSGWANTDAWGSNDAWGTPEPTPAPTINTTSTIKPSPAFPASTNDFGWGDSMSASKPAGLGNGSGGAGKDTFRAPISPPKISADEDFGGWSIAPVNAPGAGSSTAGKKPAGGGFGGSEDLFSNVWE
ncbi:MAG: hypothetical protein M1827_007733 [Pycnora praestabilis]|nr:MAG: hypothetical protein M1827_007733 [Pycnora praestabilis]